MFRAGICSNAERQQTDNQWRKGEEIGMINHSGWDLMALCDEQRWAVGTDGKSVDSSLTDSRFAGELTADGNIEALTD